MEQSEIDRLRRLFEEYEEAPNKDNARLARMGLRLIEHIDAQQMCIDKLENVFTGIFRDLHMMEEG